MSTRRKIKILMLLPNMVSAGGQRMTLNVFRALDRSRFEVKLLVQERTGSFLPETEGNPEIDYILDRLYKRQDLPYLLAQTARYAARYDIVIGALEGRAAYLGLAAAKMTNKPFIAWLHIDWKPFLPRVSWRQTLGLRSYRFADRIISCSQGSADSFIEMFDIDPSRVQTILNGIPVDSVLAGAAKEMPEQYRPLFEVPTVINVGRLDEQKSQHFLIEAHKLLIDEGHHHNLVFIGEGGLIGQLTELARTLGVDKTVHFLGYQANPHAFIKRATVFALSSLFEGLPLVLVETLVCGTPIVSTDCPSGPDEILEGGKFGTLVPMSNPRALADGIGELLTDEKKRRHLSAIGPARGGTFDGKIKIKEWESMLTQLAG